MKKRILSIILASCMVLSLLPMGAFAADDTIVLHVSTTARGKGNGTLANPYPSIDEARAAIRELNHKKKKVEVLIHGGEYKVNKKILFETADSGSEGYPVVYKAAGDGKVIFSGSVTLDLTKFTKVTDKKVYNRLPAIARDKVAQMSLEEYGITRDILDFTTPDRKVSEIPYVPILYLNDMLQDLARYPNAGSLTVNTVINAGPTSNTSTDPRAVFQYETLNPERWKDAKYGVISGLLGSEYFLDWANMDTVDTVNKTIKLKSATVYGVKPGHRWWALNLIEELDCPGEYYLDPDAMMLYYYPTKKFNMSDKLELSVLKSDLIGVSKAEYIRFEGLSFRHTLTNGVVVKSSNNLVFYDCEFINLGKQGLHIIGRNNLVEKCTFRDIGTFGVILHGGGDYATYTPSNNRVANCHFWNCARLGQQINQASISMGRNSASACIGDVIENNLFHAQPMGQAVLYGGLENVIRYNEMWEMERDIADAGVIYCGRRLNEWGNIQEYNYIHDFGAMFSAKFTVVGIYWDDYESGQTARNNIIVANNKNKTSGDLNVGAYNTLTQNIFAHLNTGVAHSSRGSACNGTAYNTFTDATRSPKAVYDKWPQMAALKAAIDASSIFPEINSTVSHNLNVDVNQINISKVANQPGTVHENNVVTDDYSVFVDYKNHDWRLTTEAMEKFGFPETMINEKNFSMDQIGIQKDVWDIQAPNAETSPFRLLYPQNGQSNVSRNGAFLKWEKALYSDQFEYVVARDPELKDVVEKGITYYNTAELYNLENGQTYYYKVYAKNLSKQIGNEWESEGAPYVFKTTQYDDLEKGFLNDEIQKLEKAMSTVVTGDKVGEFKPEIVPAAQKLLAEAKEMANLTKGDQGVLDAMTVKVRNFTKGINGYRYNGHVATPVTGEWWTTQDKVTATPIDGGVRLDATKAGAAYLKEMTSSNQIQHFKMKMETDVWVGFSLKQEKPEGNPWATTSNNYLLIVKPDIIEYQKYNPAAASTGVLKTFPNTFIKSGQWHDIVLAAIDVEGGVEIFLIVDGNEALRVYDNETPNTNSGYFSIYQSTSAGSYVELKMADNVPAGFYEFSAEEALANQNETIYNNKSDNYKSSGNWSAGPKTGYNKTALQLSKDETARASYKITDTLVAYNISYYHSPYEKADKNEKITITFYTATAAGNRVITKKVDFTQGEAGWVELGSFECSSAGQTGTVEITFSGSGEGEIVSPAIRARRVEGDEFEFSRLFYDHADNLLMMQINNQKAFNMMTPVAIPDVAPMIDAGRTMVPLRFVSEAFGAEVSWNGDTREVTIVNGDTTLVFAIDNATYTVNGEARQSDVPAKIVNGRTMVPLRVTAESLGKKVFWNGTHSMIFIADHFAFAETETDKFDLAAKGFKGFN